MKNAGIFGNNLNLLRKVFDYFKHDKIEAGRLTRKNVQDTIIRTKNVEFILKSMRNAKSESLFAIIPENILNHSISEIKNVIIFLEKYDIALQSETYPRVVNGTHEECISMENASDTLNQFILPIFYNKISIYSEIVCRSPPAMAAIYKELLQI